jgi:hypothetical protein
MPGRRPLFVPADPAHIRRVLQENRPNYRRTPFHDRLKATMGRGWSPARANSGAAGPPASVGTVTHAAWLPAPSCGNPARPPGLKEYA